MAMHAPVKQTRPRDHSGAGKPVSAIYLTEAVSEINEGAGFLDRLSLNDIQEIRRVSVPLALEPDESAFLQGDPHQGIYLIESGRIKTYYCGPSGKEITLAYWPPGHFVGGPEVFGGGTHMWSATAIEPSRLRYLPGPAIRDLVERIPTFAICLIEGLVAKGKCYSALVQMLAPARLRTGWRNCCRSWPSCTASRTAIRGSSSVRSPTISWRRSSARRASGSPTRWRGSRKAG